MRAFLVLIVVSCLASTLYLCSQASSQCPAPVCRQRQVVEEIPVSVAYTPNTIYIQSYYAQFLPNPNATPDVQTGPQQPQPQAAKPADQPPPMPMLPPVAPGTPEKPLTDSEVLRALLEEIKALRADLKRLEGQAANPQAAQGGNLADRVGPIVSHSCNQCHNAAVSDAKGGGLILVDAQGIVVQLDKANKKRVAARLQLSQMPPANAPATARLTDAERKDLLEWFKP